MKRYTILGVRQGEVNEREIAQCDTNPLAVAEAAKQQTVLVDGDLDRRRSVAKWHSIRIQENQPGQPPDWMVKGDPPPPDQGEKPPW